MLLPSIRLCALTCVVLLLTVSPSARAQPLAFGKAPMVSYEPPFPHAVVVTPFASPPNRFAAGHRGVDLSAPQGSDVRAAASGLVRFAGAVAGRTVIVIVHPDGLTTEYEPVDPLVHAGEGVRAGQVVGRVAARLHRGCANSCLHWGARRGDVYIDPMLLIRPLGRVRLVPWSANPPT